MAETRKASGSDLTPEARAQIEAVRQANRTPEARARQAQARTEFQDRPDRGELVRRGSIDPSDERATTMDALIALHKAKAAVRRIRETRGISLSDVAQRSGISVPALSRLESKQGGSFTFETLARYAAAVGLEVAIVVRDCALPGAPAGAVPAPMVALDPAAVKQGVLAARQSLESVLVALELASAQTGPGSG
jgi:transcriptional regulator with XRE-family HTH domain